MTQTTASDQRDPERWAGVDVGGRKGFDIAIIELRDDGLGLVGPPSRESSVADAADVLLSARPVMVAVDSPRTPAPDGARSRDGERALARVVCGIRYTPDLATMRAHPKDYYGWILNGFALYGALETARVSVIECFPTASWTLLGGKRGSRRRSAWTRQVLRSELVGHRKLQSVPDRLNQDGRDAIIAAYTAYLFAQGATHAFGDIVVPRASQVRGHLASELQSSRR